MHSLLDRTVAAFRGDLDAYRGGWLPAIPALAQRYGVSRDTMTRAARRLAAEGLIEMSRGRRMRCCGDRLAEPPLPGAPVAARKLAAALEGLIADGELQCGQPLPKTLALVDQFRVSPHTVSKALRGLAAKNRIHKSGKHWICGPKKIVRPRDSAAPNVIIVVQKTPEAWPGLYRSSRTEGFCRAFEEEADKRHIQIVTLVTAEENSYEGTFPAGRESFMRLTRELGERYLGALFVSPVDHMPDLREWMDIACRRGRPAVWFDRGDELARWRPGGKGRELTFRCHFHEQPAIDAALVFLCERGRRRAAFFRDTNDRWQIRRGEMLVQRARAIRPGMEITHRPPAAMQPATHVWEDYVARFITSGYPFTSRFEHHRLLAAYLSLDIDTFIAPNDRIAHWMASSLGRYTRGGGKRVSLISFDNNLYSRRLPVTSVDFGFRDLGYKAFHAIMRDLPISHDRDGNIGAKPYVADRGSVMRTLC